jgi:hypothetical protein
MVHTREAKCPGIREESHRPIYRFHPNTRCITYFKQNYDYSEYNIKISVFESKKEKKKSWA